MNSPLDPDNSWSEKSKSLHTVTILTQAPDGLRCYQAAHMMALSTWEANKADAVEWTRRNGQKLQPAHVGRYFHGISPEAKWA